VVVDTGKIDPADIKINVNSDDIEEPIIDVINYSDDFIIVEPGLYDYVQDISGAWLDRNDNCESRICDYTGYCSEWATDP